MVLDLQSTKRKTPLHNDESRRNSIVRDERRGAVHSDKIG